MVVEVVLRLPLGYLCAVYDEGVGHFLQGRRSEGLKGLEVLDVLVDADTVNLVAGMTVLIGQTNGG